MSAPYAITGETRLVIPTLEGDGLRLRAPAARDLPAYIAFCASPRSAGVGGPYGEMEARYRFNGLFGHWHIKGFGRWLVADPETDAPLGVVGPLEPPGWPEPEIAWTVFDGAEGKGIAFRAARMARAYAYDHLGWQSTISCVTEGNARSEALARRLGATFERVFEHEEFGPLRIFRHPAREALA
ncbi:MAG: GNAT family N-acetyltransferase [Pseudomonadota bacterium]